MSGMQGTCVHLCLRLAIGLSLIAPAAASSGDAWQRMREKVRSGCLLKASAVGTGNVEILVDPFGTPSFGAAILIKRGTPKAQSIAWICIMDKKTGTFELGGELPLPSR